eukprot:TRINITY_DN28591_c0_g1_i1.p1 TRINITY_DN28591_c0_g1~~TRINITY_DN28591_c0_g1_i1.p1  ORF type:complete len:451 (-),score=79.07 TRINITY_DN28591_c0_g1_i1:19-1224(-)
MVMNLTKNIIGAGVLCLPFAIQEAGLGLGLITLICMAVFSLAGFLAIGYVCHATGAQSYREAWQRTVCIFPAVVDTMIFLECVITAVGYTLLALDYSCTGLCGLFGLEAGPYLRPQIAATVSILVLVPLCLKPDLESLKATSQLGNCILLYTILYVIIEFKFSDDEPSASLSQQQLYAFFGPKRDGIFRAIVMMTSAYIAHYNAPNFMADLSSHAMPWKSFSISALASFLIALFSYSAFAAAGFLRFGPSKVLGNILLNYEGDHNGMAVMTAWLGMAVMLLLTFPITFKPARDTVTRAVNISSPEGTAHVAPTQSWCAVTVVGVFLTVFLGTTLQDISIILAFRGALLGCPISFVIPGLMLWHCPGGRAACTWQKAIAVVLVVFGCAAGFMGLLSICRDLL